MRRHAALFCLGITVAFTACLRPAPETPLDRAAAAGDLAQIERAVAAGAAVDGFDPQGWTALVWAARRGQAQAIRALLTAGADPDREDRAVNGWTALQHAVHANQPAAAAALLDGGADPNAASRGGSTALELAAFQGDPRMVRLLLERGAEPAKSPDLALSAVTLCFYDCHREGDACRSKTDVLAALRAEEPRLALAPGLPATAAYWLAHAARCGDLAATIVELKSCGRRRWNPAAS